MAQYDLILTQNQAAAGLEFAEVALNLGDQGLLIGNNSGAPTALAKGTDGQILKMSSGSIIWDNQDAGHTQNTDTGTTSQIFSIDSDASSPVKLKNNVGTLELKNNADDAYMDFEAKDAQFASVSVTSGDPSNPNELARKAYVDDQISALGSGVIFKGNVNAEGDIPDVYEVGWQYRVNTAGTYFGEVLEVGDMITAIVASTGSADAENTDWTFGQTNIDGAVTSEETSVAEGDLVSWDGTSGKVLKTTAIHKDDVVVVDLFNANTILAANADNTPNAVAIGEDAILARLTGGNIASHGLTTILAAMISKTTAPDAPDSPGTKGFVAIDDNYLYWCKSDGVGTGVNRWLRVPGAEIWS